MKKILFAASEGVPFIKTGGLADVVGSLPGCFDKEQYDVAMDLLMNCKLEDLSFLNHEIGVYEEVK